MYDINDKRSAIREIQGYLNRISRETGEFPCVVVDGIYGEETRSCVRAFQSRVGIAPTGTVDFQTFEALLREYSLVLKKAAEHRCVILIPDKLYSGVIAKGEESGIVSIIQALLSTLRVIYDDIGDVEINGIFDTATEEAVKALQRIDGIPETGIIDTATWNALVSAYEKFVNADT